MRLSHLLARNAMLGGGARLVSLLVGLFLTPYLLARLGAERFGIWALATTVTGALGFLDLSLKSAFVKHLAETEAREERDDLAAVVTTGFAAYLLFAIVLAALFVPLRRGIVELLGIPPELEREAIDVFTIATASFLVGVVMSVFVAVCDARQRMDLTHGLGTATLLLSTAVTVAAVEAGQGLRGVALAQLFGVVLFFALATLAGRRLVGSFGLRPSALSREWLGRLLRFGATLHVSTACGIVNRQLDKFLLSRWAGLGLVTSYEVAARLTANAGSFQTFLAAALLPAASRLEALGQRDELLRVYRRASRYLFLVGIPPFVFLAVDSRNVLLAWLGREDAVAAAILVLLCGGYLVNSLSNGMAFVCQGVGRPGIQAYQSAVQLVANVAASVGLFVLFGPLGAAAGTSLAFLVGAAVFARRLHAHLGISTAGLLREAALVPALCALAAAAAGRLAALWVDAGDRSGALIEIGIDGAVFSAVYLATCRWSGLIGAGDLSRLWTALRGRGLVVPR